MRIGINSGFYNDQYSDIEAIKIIAENGFDAVDYSYYLYACRGSVFEKGDWRTHLKEVKRIADINNVDIYQMHAPLFKYVDEEVDEDFKLEMTKIAFEACSILGCRYLVMHPRKFRNYRTEKEKEYARAYNIAMYRSYIPLAKKYNVKIAIENMFRYDMNTNEIMDTIFQTSQEMNEYLEILPEAYFCACVDTGHANINFINPAKMVLELKERMRVLHIHDNFQVLDSHIPPFMGQIHWGDFMEALKSIKFAGVFSFEILPNESFALAEEGKYLYHLGKDMLNKYNL